MLTGVRYRLVGRDKMPPGHKIQWGQISSRIDVQSGTKAQDATLYNEENKAVAWYYAASDEVAAYWGYGVNDDPDL